MNNHAIKSGVITGVISVIIGLLIYIIDPTIFGFWWLPMLLGLIYATLIVYFGILHRNQEGGFLSFGQAWVYSFTGFIMYRIISVSFSILLFFVIDPSLPEVVTEAMVQNFEAFMKFFGMPEEQLEEALEKARNDAIEGFTIVGSLKGFAWGLITYAILSLISGAIIKKNEPELEG